MRCRDREPEVAQVVERRADAFQDEIPARRIAPRQFAPACARRETGQFVDRRAREVESVHEAADIGIDQGGEQAPAPLAHGLQGMLQGVARMRDMARLVDDVQRAHLPHQRMHVLRTQSADGAVEAVGHFLTYHHRQPEEGTARRQAAPEEVDQPRAGDAFARQVQPAFFHELQEHQTVARLLAQLVQVIHALRGGAARRQAANDALHEDAFQPQAGIEKAEEFKARQAPPHRLGLCLESVHASQGDGRRRQPPAVRAKRLPREKAQGILVGGAVLIELLMQAG